MTKSFCDKCHEEIKGVFEKQESYTISFCGGYASVFGDGARVHIELCQTCLYSILDSTGLLNESTIRNVTEW